MQIEFTDMAYGGDAVGRDPSSGLAVFAWPAIKGETATVEVTTRRPNLLRGIVSQVQDASPLRTEPPCPYFGTCGGCQWQHISYDGQVRFKNETLRSQLQRLGGLSDVAGILGEPIPSPQPFAYRNSSHFAIHPESKALAYYKRDSHSLLPVAACPISNEGINRTIPFVNSLLAQAFTHESLGGDYKGIMRAWKVSIRSSIATGQTVVVFHSEAGGQAKPKPGMGRKSGRRASGRSSNRPDIGPSPEEALDPERSPAILMSRREVKRAVQSLAQVGVVGEPLALTVVEVMGDGTVNLLGVSQTAGALATDALAEMMSGSLLRRDTVRSGAGRSDPHPPLGTWFERLGDRGYWVAPNAFFQVNTSAAEEMLAEVTRYMPAKVQFMLDAHAGVGTFAIALAGRCSRVLGFEMDTSAVASAQWNAHATNMSNVEFRQGRAEQLISRLTESERPDLVLLDPPRSGCDPALLAEIERRAVPRIIYVSCDPSTLARDVKVLSANYSLTSARMVDMFPQTYHIETVAVLDRR
ncbi:MAG TPA: class I SAM-dependent RNA methyltransferase [Chloroflexia bacterium]|nr:class I SAM-dependent RNA methyltransferase [Chloroflexia bacterium]